MPRAKKPEYKGKDFASPPPLKALVPLDEFKPDMNAYPFKCGICYRPGRMGYFATAKGLRDHHRDDHGRSKR